MKVLVVDDDPAIRELLVTVLGDEGYDVVTAGDGTEALEMAPRERPDALLVDVMMPRMDGRTLVRRLRELPEVAAAPAIMMSAAVGSAGAMEGVFDFVPKPFDLDRLLDSLERALAG